jgi:hypothetical protein
MLPAGGKSDASFQMIIVAPMNTDPYLEHLEAIEALGAHLGLTLDRASCYPYGRGGV